MKHILIISSKNVPSANKDCHAELVTFNGVGRLTESARPGHFAKKRIGDAGALVLGRELEARPRVFIDVLDLRD